MTRFHLAFVASVALFVGCGPDAIPAVDPVGLSAADVEVLRAVVEGALRSRLAAKEVNRLEVIIRSPTRTIGLCRNSPPRTGPFPEPPAPFGHPQPAPPPPATASIDESMLTPAERAAWATANRRTQEIPDLALAGFRVSGTKMLETGRIYVVVSAPAYATSNSAVVYAAFGGGGLCAEGWLVHLVRQSPIWSVSRAEMLWIS